MIVDPLLHLAVFTLKLVFPVQLFMNIPKTVRLGVFDMGTECHTLLWAAASSNKM